MGFVPGAIAQGLKSLAPEFNPPEADAHPIELRSFFYAFGSTGVLRYASCVVR